MSNQQKKKSAGKQAREEKSDDNGSTPRQPRFPHWNLAIIAVGCMVTAVGIIIQAVTQFSGWSLFPIVGVIAAGSYLIFKLLQHIAEPPKVKILNLANLNGPKTRPGDV